MKTYVQPARPEFDETPIYTHHIFGGYTQKLLHGQEEFCTVFAFKCYKSAAGGLFGYVYFPETFETHFNGTIEELENLIKRSQSVYLLFQNRRWKSFF